MRRLEHAADPAEELLHLCHSNLPRCEDAFSAALRNLGRCNSSLIDSCAWAVVAEHVDATMRRHREETLSSLDSSKGARLMLVSAWQRNHADVLPTDDASAQRLLEQYLVEAQKIRSPFTQEALHAPLLDVIVG